MADGNSGILDSAAYVIVDTHTGAIVYRTTYKRRRAALSRADRMDNEYGGYRYACRVLDTSAA